MRSLARLSRGRLAARKDTALGQSHIGLRDWVLSILVVLAHLAPVQSGQSNADPSAGWVEGVAPFLALGSGLALLWRRRHPRAVAGFVLACYAGLALVQGLVPPYAGWVLIWSLATSGEDRRRSVALASVTAAATSLLLVAAELTRPGDGALALLVAITVLVLLAAVLVRSERSRVEAVGRRAATEERLRIARDLHDLVGHGLSTIAVQSSTARMALQSGDDAAAGTALSAVESSSRIALREMRQMLGVLMDVDDAESSLDRPSHSDGGATTCPRPGRRRPTGRQRPRGRCGRDHGADRRLGQRLPWSPARGLPGRPGGAHQRGEACAGIAGHRPPRRHGRSRQGLGRDGRNESVAGRASGSGTHGGGLGLDGLRTRVAALSGEFACGPTDRGWIIEARMPLHEEGDR